MIISPGAGRDACGAWLWERVREGTACDHDGGGPWGLARSTGSTPSIKGNEIVIV